MVVADALYYISLPLLLGILLFFDSIDSSLLESYPIHLKTILYNVLTVTHEKLTCLDSLVQSLYLRELTTTSHWPLR